MTSQVDAGPDQPLLPADTDRALLVGRIWSAGDGGPLPVLLREGEVLDVSELAPTVSQLFELPDIARRLEDFRGRKLCESTTALGHAQWERSDRPVRLLAPIDLQCLKACGVTFAVSVLERVVEEQARGNPEAAEAFRSSLRHSLGERLHDVEPGSSAAAEVKEVLVSEGLWSPYLEVAIGPDAEIFTKAPPLSAVGWGDWIGIRDDSDWNNSEPEVVLVCNSKGQIIGATLGNDVNLRDFEGRSALLLGKAKDNNASAAVGPFVRVLEDDFTMDDIRSATVSLSVQGEDGFHFHTESTMDGMSRDPETLVAQTCGRHHDYPDGFALYLGSLIAPTQDREAPGKGFTHHTGDTVIVSSPRLGALVNRVTHSADAPRWEFGIAALMQNLARRGLLDQR